jgi:uncharacterized protein DUF4260
MHTVALAPRRVGARVMWGALAALLLAALLFEVVPHGAGYWQLAAFGLGPDLALVLGVGTHLAKGQLHPRAVPLYNLVHRFWLPAALLALAAFGVVPHGFVVGGLAWCFHVALDRTVGYGLRTRDGFQR